jgi:5'-methylthioinosine phosphorylase
MVEIAIIGGTGLLSLDGLEILRQESIATEYGAPSSPITIGELAGQSIAFLPRHGAQHTIPPHKVNYRANLQALNQLGVKTIIAVAAVGGIQSHLGPAVVVIPDQIIDYTWSREQTFFSDDLSHVTHIDFTYPYTMELREKILLASQKAGVDVVNGGVYAATQGPRLETAKEIDRLESDGCNVVGMTGMPEASLARELDIDYASINVVANYAAGRSDSLISMAEIEASLVEGMGKVKKILATLLI